MAGRSSFFFKKKRKGREKRVLSSGGRDAMDSTPSCPFIHCACTTRSCGPDLEGGPSIIHPASSPSHPMPPHASTNSPSSTSPGAAYQITHWPISVHHMYAGTHTGMDRPGACPGACPVQQHWLAQRRTSERARRRQQPRAFAPLRLHSPSWNVGDNFGFWLAWTGSARCRGKFTQSSAQPPSDEFADGPARIVSTCCCWCCCVDVDCLARPCHSVEHTARAAHWVAGRRETSRPAGGTL